MEVCVCVCQTLPVATGARAWSLMKNRSGLNVWEKAEKRVEGIPAAAAEMGRPKAANTTRTTRWYRSVGRESASPVSW